MTSVNPVHSNSCDPSYAGQFVLSRTRFSDYKRYNDEVLRKIIIQIAIDPFVNVRAMIELLQKTLIERKDVDRHIINNHILYTQKKVRIEFKEY